MNVCNGTSHWEKFNFQIRRGAWSRRLVRELERYGAYSIDMRSWTPAFVPVRIEPLSQQHKATMILTVYWRYFCSFLGDNLLIFKKRMAGACGNRTHPSSFWPETPALKAGRDTRTRCTPEVDTQWYYFIFHVTSSRDGVVKSPYVALRCIFATAEYNKVRLIPQNLRALPPELFTKPSTFLTSYELVNHSFCNL